MSERLRRYLAERERGGWEWKARYEAKEMAAADQGWAWLAGWYGGMLDELLATLDKKQIKALLDADVDDSAPREW